MEYLKSVVVMVCNGLAGGYWGCRMVGAQNLRKQVVSLERPDISTPPEGRSVPRDGGEQKALRVNAWRNV